MRIALVGTRGAPARYGGFETAVEEIGAGLAERGHEVLVYCRERSPKGRSYRGMRRVVAPALRRRSLETLSHTAASTPHVIFSRPDAVVVFNAANAPFAGAIRVAGIPVALHMDGHDARRAKWQGLGGRYYRWATRWGFRIANEVIVDSEAVGEEMARAHRRSSTFIPYGARPQQRTSTDLMLALDRHGLVEGGYHLIVARFEPENHVVEIIKGFLTSAARKPLVVVGFAGYSGPYSDEVQAASSDPRVRLMGAVWDQRLLDDLYAGAATYVHGHSVGGTNPSLLRAMAQRSPVLAYDCPYNLETTGGHARFWQDPTRLSRLLEEAEQQPGRAEREVTGAFERVCEVYAWPTVVDAYESLLSRLTMQQPSRPVGSGE